jgi:CRP/FNR family transcriptional regulator, cyclic AMP receptor protein
MSQEAGFAMIARLSGEAETISLRPGDFLFREGDDADALYIVKRGVVRVVSGSTVYETVRAGGIVGEMAIADEGSLRSASVIAGTYAELIRIDTAGFLTLIEGAPDFALIVMRVMARRLRVMNQRYRPASVWNSQPASLHSADR